LTKPPPTHRERLDAIAPPDIRAEAAVWVAELHSPTRDAQVEANVRGWLAEDPRHAAAFELATEAWQRSGNLSADLPQRPADPSDEPVLATLNARPRPARMHPSRKRATYAGIATLGVALAVVTYMLTDDTLTTAPNEQKTVVLSDGTQVTLNANSRLRVHFNDQLRKLTLIRGEVLFNVAKHLPRPFVVIIGDRKVIAMGTSFEVRRDESLSPAFTVTLVEGRVAIEPLSAPNVIPAAAPDTSASAPSQIFPAGSQRTSPPQLTVLSPGERLRVAPNSTDTLDHPKIDTITAWQHGQLIFDDVSLAEAAQEFNRYGTMKITIAGASTSHLRIGGVFRIGDPQTFAEVVADTYKLHLTTHADQIVLAD
jgi:transmembrane sensor